MLFHSWPFVVLLALTLTVCGFVRPLHRWVVLLISSLVFYGWWRIDYLGLMLLTAASCYLAAVVIDRSATMRTRRGAMILAIAINLLVLGLFKYLGLFVDLYNSLAATNLRPSLGLLLPVGISFYTFQSIGYVVDVFRGQVRAERNPARLLLFVSFFPQLVAGPIERAPRLLRQLAEPIILNAAGFRFGLWLILWGFFKKLVIADRAALFANNGFDYADQRGGLVLGFAILAFAIQIYCDFSAYSDIAIGTARLFGIRLRQNFNRPYAARSLQEFWQRWHISLSTWFRDYVYVPLGGNQTGALRWCFSIIVVFGLSGLWHGAAWTFLFWGLLHGVGLIAERFWITQGSLTRYTTLRSRPLFRAAAMIVVLLGWVLFRSHTIGDAANMLQQSARNPFSLTGFRPDLASGLDFPWLVLGIIWLWVIERPFDADAKWRVDSWVGGKSRAATPWMICITLLMLLNLGMFNNPTQFIYFQF